MYEEFSTSIAKHFYNYLIFSVRFPFLKFISSSIMKIIVQEYARGSLYVDDDDDDNNDDDDDEIYTSLG